MCIVGGALAVGTVVTIVVVTASKDKNHDDDYYNGYNRNPNHHPDHYNGNPGGGGWDVPPEKIGDEGPAEIKDADKFSLDKVKSKSRIHDLNQMYNQIYNQISKRDFGDITYS